MQMPILTETDLQIHNNTPREPIPMRQILMVTAKTMAGTLIQMTQQIAR